MKRYKLLGTAPAPRGRGLRTENNRQAWTERVFAELDKPETVITGGRNHSLSLLTRLLSRGKHERNSKSL